jgi:uncharacterized protein
MASMEIRDPIHGFVSISPSEERVINSPVFQRLRRIRQLAAASLVYPGALHTRFDHSLGVLCLARRLSERLLPGSEHEDHRRLVRLTALLHDLGHGPFSHVSESLLILFSKREALHDDRHLETLHEAVTCNIIKYSEDLRPLISESDRNQIIDVLSMGSNRLVREIVSGPLDADKLDYLLRDSHFCGVRYGVYDLERLVGSIEPGEGRNPILAISEGGVHSLEQFILAKYYMTTQVYRHRVRLITDQMITRGLKLGVEEDGIDWLHSLYAFQEGEEHCRTWVQYDDDVLSHRLLTLRGYAAGMFARLRERRLHKRISRANVARFSPVARLVLLKPFVEVQPLLEGAIASLLGMDPKLVIAHRYTVQSRREDEQDSVGNIMVRGPSGMRPFNEVSPLFAALDSRYKQIYLEFYVPAQDGGSISGEDLEATWSETIAAEVESVLQTEGSRSDKPTSSSGDACGRGCGQPGPASDAGILPG